MSGVSAAELEAKSLSEAIPTLRNTQSEGCVKIIDKINASIAKGKPFYSFEFFPPKTEAGVENLYSRIYRMATDFEPSFIDVTWGAGGSTADLTLEISSVAQNQCGAEVMMHLTCTNMKVADVKSALVKAKAAGIRNILALRGDPPHGVDVWEKSDGGLSHAADLVRLIREEHGDYFGIGVAGYPEGHLECTSIDEDIQHLKAKLDAGADFVVTQLFYDCGVFSRWVDKCRAAGITQPIIPGILPIQSYAGFMRMVGFCKTHVPEEVSAALEAIKDDDSAVKDYGVELAVNMCEQLMEQGVPGLHFYTLNLERSVVTILETLGFIASPKVRMPWKQSVVPSRAAHEVSRPVFWANRPHSFEIRTRQWNWDEFTGVNGRWGDSSSPAFGELSNHHLCPVRAGTSAERRALWGENPAFPRQIFSVFARYIEGSVPRLPWCEGTLSAESTPLREQLMQINNYGFLTINSQPKVNGAPSDDPTVGWGGSGGYVYQKAYVEFFVSPSNFQKFAKAAVDFPSLRYLAMNAQGDRESNYVQTDNKVTTVTWGVFPCKEIQQPTVVDNEAFAIWKDEAFALWKSQWQSIYPKDSESYQLLQTIHDTYWLVNVVDNNYVSGDIFAVFNKIIV